MRNVSLATAVLLAAACAACAPVKGPAVGVEVPVGWGIDGATGSSDPIALPGWRSYFSDERLQAVIEQALENNRDLRVAVINVERARQQYRAQGADRLPGLAATGEMDRRGGSAPVTEQATAGAAISDFELDFFGRVRSLTTAAQQRYFSVAANRRQAQIVLVSEVATAWVILGSDKDLLATAERTRETYTDALRVVERRAEIGAASSLEVQQSRALLERAETDVARLRGQVQLDMNALQLLAGSALLPQHLPETRAAVADIAADAVRTPSAVLLRRPDVVAAEYQLAASEADIGAARAAFFPSITLTGTYGSASDQLSDLFTSGTRAWSFIPRISIPIFSAGKLKANLRTAQADRDIALSNYERSIQVAFREVADALAQRDSLKHQAAAQVRLVEASRASVSLAETRYRAGLDSFVTLLDARRSSYEYEQGVIEVTRSQQLNRVSLYRALGGGWDGA